MDYNQKLVLNGSETYFASNLIAELSCSLIFAANTTKISYPLLITTITTVSHRLWGKARCIREKKTVPTENNSSNMFFLVVGVGTS